MRFDSNTRPSWAGVWCSRSTPPTSPSSATRCSRERPLADFLAWVELVVGAINGALIGIDPSRVRLHVCWGNYEGPHTLDVALEEILPLLYRGQRGRVGGVDGQPPSCP